MDTGWLFLILSIFIYGLWGFLAKVSQQRGASPHLLTVLTALGTVIVAVCVCLPRLSGALPRPFKSCLLPGILGGVCVGIANILLYRALQGIPASIVYPVSSLYVLVTVLLAVLFLHERLDALHAFGIVLAVVSIFILSR